jgi:1-acyl-sn-glycerol-3-phosphate acyltransferase
VSATHRYVFDLDPERDMYFCTADVGWITGHSYIVYGPLANGATSVIYEGAPDYPHKAIWWELCERFNVSIFYTAPTAIRSCMKWGPEHPNSRDLSSLRVLGTMGLTETKPGSATHALPGVAADVLDEATGESVPQGQGLLVLKRPWPAMLRTLYGDDERYVETYWSRFGPETYVVGDAAIRDKDGYLWIVGRIDDVINVSGHRLSTAEVESAIVAHEKVAEAAVVAQSDELTGQAIVAFARNSRRQRPAPGLGDYFRQVGVIPASRQGVTAALSAGCDVIIWPGGDLDAMRNWRRRDEAVLAGRKGFVRTAIRSGVPIVPVATVGGHDTAFVLSEGRWIANGLDRVSGLKKKLRGSQLPIVLGFPFGLTIETIVTHLPLPAKIRTELLDPIPLDHDPERVNDHEYVNAVYSEVESAIQAAMYRLAKQRRFPIFAQPR